MEHSQLISRIVLLSKAIITDDNWHRIGLVWDGPYRMLYVDDVAVAEDTQTNLEASEKFCAVDLELFIFLPKSSYAGSSLFKLSNIPMERFHQLFIFGIRLIAQGSDNSPTPGQNTIPERCALNSIEEQRYFFKYFRHYAIPPRNKLSNNISQSRI
ncbi:MAG: hypothetical protein GTO24_04695 [candidate division Zixibacteria bacterium]|nr:hypothetical protein [candidate division Zixibacteria bacterium]